MTRLVHASATVPLALRAFFAGLPLLPLMAGCVPAPRDECWSGFLRAQEGPSGPELITGTLSSGLIAAGTSTSSPATVTATEASTGGSALAIPAYPGQPDANPPQDLARRRSEAVLFFPPDTPPPSPPTPAAIESSGTASPTSASAASSSAAAAATPDGTLNLGASPPDRTDDPGGGRGGEPSRPLLMAYYPDWVGDVFPPEKVDFGRFDWVDFAFAVPDTRLNLTWDGADDAPDLLRQLVALARKARKNVKLSVGGWTGSRYFSTAAATPEGRTTLANNILALYREFDLDGIDIDWEYPAQDGLEGNLVRSDDSANFLAFLYVLRNTLPPTAKITAATQTVPFAGPDGDPMGNVSAFAEVLDWVLLMNYDTWGSSSDPGPNAPLSDSCKNSTQGSASALAAVRAWTAAGFPASKLVLGVPSYGYLSRSSASFLRTRAIFPRARSGRSRKQKGRRARDQRRAGHSRVLDWVGALVDKTKDKILPAGQTLIVNEDGGTDDGQVQFRELVRQGVLRPYNSTSNGSSSSAAVHPTKSARAPQLIRLLNGNNGATDLDIARSEAVRAMLENAEPRALFAGGGGFERGWDACSSTPFLRSAAARQVVAYDDPVSLEMKAQLVREAGMRGANMFDVHGDTDEWDLADALLRGLGVK